MQIIAGKTARDLKTMKIPNFHMITIRAKMPNSSCSEISFEMRNAVCSKVTGRQPGRVHEEAQPPGEPGAPPQKCP